MNRLIALALIMFFAPGISLAQEVSVVIKGSSWDSDSHGFAYQGALTVQEDTETSVRRGSRVSVDGYPELFAISDENGAFEITLVTDRSSFRLIIEGDRFPRTISQPFAVPEDDGELDVGRVYSPRAEGNEHTWPLPMAAAALGYSSTYTMLADNKAAIRLLTFGSGSDGAPDFTSQAKITFPDSDTDSRDPEPTTASPFLMRIPKSEYLLPIWMNAQDTYFESAESANGAYIVIVSFEAGDPIDKDIVIQIEDTITDELLVPPRPWKFGPRTISVRNGFATEYWTWPDIEGVE